MGGLEGQASGLRSPALDRLTRECDRSQVSGRPVVVDVSGALEPIEACPGCGASFAWVTRASLREVAFDWRCRPGHHPKTFELRCRDCKRLSIVYDAGDGTLAFVPNQDDAVRVARDRAREDAISLDRFDGRDRDR